ncbi:MAG TPA: hypothetical protein DCG47_04940 [Spirochaetaceae bacterium]|nr:hypothetical protein [Spirochaetaceae bacterium]
MMLAFSGLIFAVFSALLVYILVQSSYTHEQAIIGASRERTAASAARLEGRLQKAAKVAEDLAAATVALKESGVEGRSVLPAMCKELLAANGELFAVWIVFIPNAWDAKDARFADEEEYAPTGAFLPWAYRDGDTIALQAGMQGDDDIDLYFGEFYSLPLERGRPVFLEPYVELHDGGVEVLMTTYALPIRGSDGVPLGVAGIDLSLDFINDVVGAHSIGSAYAALVSEDSAYLGHGNDEALAGEPVGEHEPPEVAGALAELLASGSGRTLKGYPDANGTPALRVLEPVTLPGGAGYWIFMESIPEASLYSERNRSIVASLLMFALAMALSLLVVFIVSAGITKPLGSLRDAFRRMEEGELGFKVPVVSKDEIGDLSTSFNVLSLSLRNLMESLKHAVRNLEDNACALSDSANSTSGNALRIRGEVRKAKESAQAQSACVEQSSAQAAGILDKISELGAVIASQNNSIADASASIEQMVGNIQALAENASAVKREVEGLESSSANGKRTIEAAIAGVAGLASRSEDLLGANKIISDIAAKTNLLAMNAAIEAAHAGDAGAGFAVVAEEIRSLADGARGQSKLISDKIADIRKVIGETSSLSGAAGLSFDDILDRIRLVSRLEAESFGAVSEQREGSRLVLKALEELKAAALSVERAGNDMALSGSEVGAAMERLSRISQAVWEIAGVIALGMDDIDANLRSEIGQVDETRKLASALSAEIGRLSSIASA